PAVAASGLTVRGRLPTMNPGRTFRGAMPYVLVLVVWLAVTAVGGPFFGRLAEVVEQSAASFLPATAESTRVSEIQAASSQDANPPAIVLFHVPSGAGAATRSALDERFAEIMEL